MFIWGEPGFLSDFRKLAERADTYLKKVQHNRRTGLKNNIGNWRPVVSPAPERLNDALRSFFNSLYQSETRQLGLNRWGFKEVRADAFPHMRLLGKIYPGARFLFLVRDPYDMYRSVKGKKFHANFTEPLQPVRIWSNNVKDYLSDREMCERCKMVRYEELIKISRQNTKLLYDITSHFGVNVSEKMFRELETRMDPSGGRMELTDKEIKAITDIAGDCARHLGYPLR